MPRRSVGAREQGRDRKRLTRIDRTEHDADLCAARELGRAIHRLGRIALRITCDQLELAAIDATGLINFFNSELRAAIDADAGGLLRAGKRGQVSDRDRGFLSDSGLGDRAYENGGAGGLQRLTTSHVFEIPPDS